MGTSIQPGLTAARASGRPAATRAAIEYAKCDAEASLNRLMFIAGDHVTIGADTRVYKIVHLARHKAWISALRAPDQRLVSAEDLLLVGADVTTLRN